MRGLRGEPLVLGAAFRIQSKRCRDALEKRGFPRAVLSHEERYRCFEPQFSEMANGGGGIRIVARGGPQENLPGHRLGGDGWEPGGPVGAGCFYFRRVAAWGRLLGTTSRA